MKPNLTTECKLFKQPLRIKNYYDNFEFYLEKTELNLNLNCIWIQIPKLI